MGRKKGSGAVESASAYPIEKFVRLRRTPASEGGHFDAYQVEIVEIQGAAVVSRELYDKPNLFEFAWAQAADLVDPRNEL